jgi:hypothetical protein
MAQRSNYLNDGQTFHDDRASGAMWKSYPHPLLIAPQSGYGYFNDFITFSEDEWTITVVEVGTGNSTIAMKDEAGGILRVNCAANENDGAQAQSDGECIVIPAAGSIAMEARINLTDDATQSDAFFGLATVDTSIIAGAPNDVILWRKDDGDTNWDFLTDTAGSPTTTTGAHTAVADTWVILGFTFDGTTVYPYVDGVRGTGITTTIPTATEMMISFGYLNGAGSAQNEGMDIDWIKLVVLTDRS